MYKLFCKTLTTDNANLEYEDCMRTHFKVKVRFPRVQIFAGSLPDSLNQENNAIVRNRSRIGYVSKICGIRRVSNSHTHRII